MPNPNYNPLNGIIVNNGTSPYGAKISNEDNGNIAPRVGFAWQPWNNGKTVIRGGYGMFYDSSLFGIVEQNIFANPPFVNTVSISSVTLDNPAAGTATVSATPKALHATMLPNRTPYVQQASLDIQHEFKGGFFLDVAYVWNNGRTPAWRRRHKHADARCVCCRGAFDGNSRGNDNWQGRRTE